ncbi:chemotaxis protein CheX [Calidifontibacillus oryziterrae]|uniref:chemotaxis protein CheX n=1 Tax=Calidifontibacillus oryziterrae TaxID=1191699 RepID=UPI000475D740|nr:chemotaxis protein CheX [Calidifontibacillus oryziterrae]
MSLAESVTHVLNGTIESVKTVIPVPLAVGKPSLMTQPLEQTSIGVLIGMVGHVRGRLVIESDEPTFGSIGEAMFGMALEGEMLQSFTGELGNMLAGNLCTIVAQKGLEIDITPPTVMVGQSKLFGFERAFRVPVEVQGKGELQIILMIETN